MSSPESNCDRLSNLPDEILQHILSFLPTPESGRTCVLSQRWHHLWRGVPTFHFDVKDLPNQVEVDGTVPAACEQAEKINQFIARRDATAPLLRFHLRIRYGFLDLPFSINPWIRYARSHGVRNMTVHINCMRKRSSCSTFFDLPSIEVLDLWCLPFAVLWTLPQRIDVSNLKVLSLLVSEESISGQSLTSLLSSCPAVQELTVHHGQCSQDLDITAPNLRRLTIIDSAYTNFTDSYNARITCPKLEYLHWTIRALLKDFEGHLPSLKEASVVFSCSSLMSSNQFEEIFISLGSVTKLTLRLKCYPWCFFGIMSSFPVFHSLKQLKFSAAMREDFIKQVLLLFVGCSPHLSSLQVLDEQEDHLSRTVEDYIQHSVRLRLPRKPLDRLETVSVEGISNAATRHVVLQRLSKLVMEWERVVVIS